MRKIAQCLAVLSATVLLAACSSTTGAMLNGRTIAGAPVYPFDKDGHPKAVRIEAEIVNLSYLLDLDQKGLLDPKTRILGCTSIENHQFRTTGSDSDWKPETEGFILTSSLHETPGFCGVTQKERKLYFAAELDPATGLPVRPQLKHVAWFGDATLGDKLAVAFVNAGGQVVAAGAIAYGDVEAASRIANGLRHRPSDQTINEGGAGGKGGRGGDGGSVKFPPPPKPHDGHGDDDGPPGHGKKY
jgi:hypothetical protein